MVQDTSIATHTTTNMTTFEIKPYSNKELSHLYGIGDRTFTKWLAPFKDSIGPKVGRYYTVLQVKIIVEKLGMPYKMEE